MLVQLITTPPRKNRETIPSKHVYLLICPHTRVSPHLGRWWKVFHPPKNGWALPTPVVYYSERARVWVIKVAQESSVQTDICPCLLEHCVPVIPHQSTSITTFNIMIHHSWVRSPSPHLCWRPVWLPSVWLAAIMWWAAAWTSPSHYPRHAVAWALWQIWGDICKHLKSEFMSTAFWGQICAFCAIKM